jgi:uracil-DNA glycosylase
MHVMTQCNFDDFTVRDRQPNSHARKGWERFTDAAIRTVSQQRSGVVFVLWGNAAQEKMR